MEKLTYDLKFKRLRRQLRNEMDKSETVFWKNVKAKQLGFKFRRQVNIGNYIVDFYCAELKLVVEVDGSTHYEEEIFEKDLAKDKFLTSAGFIVKRYNSGQIFKNIREVMFDLGNIYFLPPNSVRR